MTAPSAGEPRDRACGDDVAAYALGALPPAEAEAFRRHLESCAICRDELIAFRAVVETLPLSAEAHRAPGALRRRVMREVRADARAREQAAARRAPRRTVRFAPALGAAVALAAVVVALVIGISGSAPSVRVIHAQVIGPGQASLRVSGGHSELVVDGLPAPPAGKIYEVWLGHRNGPPSPTSALFSVTRSGRGDVAVPGSLRGVTQVMVTPEPAGGSHVPTHAPVIVVKV